MPTFLAAPALLGNHQTFTEELEYGDKDTVRPLLVHCMTMSSSVSAILPPGMKSYFFINLVTFGRPTLVLTHPPCGSTGTKLPPLLRIQVAIGNEASFCLP